MFKVGDSVIYPQHGAAVIEGVQDREVGGETREYLVLKLSYGDLTLMVPRDNCQEVGIREVCSSDDVEGVFEILRTGESSTQGNWSRRFKGNIERLQSGDIFQVAEVVRDHLRPRRAWQVGDVVAELGRLTPEELMDQAVLAKAVNLTGEPDALEAPMASRGYRVLGHIPQLAEPVIDRVVDRFGSLKVVLAAGLEDLEEVEGVGQGRARQLREGLLKLAGAQGPTGRSLPG